MVQVSLTVADSIRALEAEEVIEGGERRTSGAERNRGITNPPRADSRAPAPFLVFRDLASARAFRHVRREFQARLSILSPTRTKHRQPFQSRLSSVVRSASRVNFSR